MIGGGRLRKELGFLQHGDDVAAKTARICLLYLVLIFGGVALGRVVLTAIA